MTPPPHLKIMLFCSGNGAAPYRPESDTTQWWNRRDALVRCVASSLPFATELCLYFPEDQTTLSHRFFDRDSCHFCPTERNVIQLWQRAASQPGTSITESKVSCRFVRHGSSQSNPRGTTQRSKRDILETLQTTAGIEFLRQHGLNSSAEVILRKISREKLVKIEKLLLRRSRNNSSANDPLKNILRDFLQNSSVAVTLHESSENELACWGTVEDSTSNATNTSICLFLGAVRDMTDHEHRVLRQIHGNVQAVRLGPVAEFTSKILTVAGFHQYHGRWGFLSREIKDTTPPPPQLKPLLLHFALTMDMPSTMLSSDLAKRNRTLWCLVRCLVNALWRSKLGMKKVDDSGVNSKVTITYSDRRYQELTQDLLVPRMAEAHQAAPSEYQILEALMHTPILDQSPLDFCSFDSIIDFDDSECSVRQAAYDVLPQGPANDYSKVAILLHLPHERKEKAPFQHHTSVQPVNGHRLLQVPPNMLDRPAVLITMTQHLAYQNRLLSLLKHHGRSVVK